MSAGHRLPAGANMDQSQTCLRLVLAGSIALLLHALVAAGLALHSSEIAPERTVQLQLVPQGTESSAQARIAAQAHTNLSQQPAAPSRTAPPTDFDDRLSERTVPETVTTGNSERAVTEAQTSRLAEPEETRSISTSSPLDELPEKPETASRPAPEPEPTNIASSPALSSMTGAPSGAAGLTSDVPEEDLASQRSSRPDLPKMDPYLLALSRHMLQPLKRVLRHRPTLAHFNKALETGARPITIELRLFSNGAVRRVRLTKSSGSDVVDRITVQSALAASPYPPPPEKERANGFRFKLDLVMSPVYL